MPRATQAQQIENDNELHALEFFKQKLAALPDPRRPQGIRYPLNSVVVIALMAMICGCDDAESMQLWGEIHQTWLEKFLALPHGTPTQDVFLAVFAALDPKAFGAVLRAWAALLVLRLNALHKHIAVDGKTSRHSFDSANETPAIHTVSAYMREAGLTLGEYKTESKSNEITAIPALLRLLDICSATITIDAMGCQTEIAQTIVDGGGNYILAVKENQPTLCKDIADIFAEADDARMRTVEEQPRPAIEIFEEVDKGHGRLEKRTVKLCRDLSWLTTKERWTELKFVVQVTRERTSLKTQKTSVEVVYYIGSDASISVSDVARTIRHHWSIENELHWVLDIGFREDEARHRAQNTAQNMTILRRFALNIIKRDAKRKLGVANSRKRAGFDRNYLLHLLMGAQA